VYLAQSLNEHIKGMMVSFDIFEGELIHDWIGAVQLDDDPGDLEGAMHGEAW